MANVDNLGGGSETDIHFRWGPDEPSGNTLPNTTSRTTVTSTGEYSEEITGLSTDTVYDAKAVISGDEGNKVTFTTNDDVVVEVDNLTSSWNSDTSQTLSADLTDLGGASSADVHFEWRQEGASTWNDTSLQTLTSTGTFSADLTGLSEETTYEARAIAEASDGDWEVTDVDTFTTTGDPVVETDGSSNVTSTSADLTGEAFEFGAPSADGFFEWGPVGGSLSNATEKVAVDFWTSGGYFTITVDGLDPDTKYEFRAVLEGSDGEQDRGDVLTFRTDK